MAAATHEHVRDREIDQARKTLEDLRARRKELDTEIAQAELIIQAWQNFEDTLKGRFKPPTVVPDALPEPTEKPKRARKGERAKLRWQIWKLVSTFPDHGLASDGIHTEMKTTEKDRGKVATLLSTMKTDGYLMQKGGKGSSYFVGPNIPPEPEDEATDVEAAA